MSMKLTICSSVTSAEEEDEGPDDGVGEEGDEAEEEDEGEEEEGEEGEVCTCLCPPCMPCAPPPLCSARFYCTTALFSIPCGTRQGTNTTLWHAFAGG